MNRPTQSPVRRISKSSAEVLAPLNPYARVADPVPSRDVADPFVLFAFNNMRIGVVGEMTSTLRWLSGAALYAEEHSDLLAMEVSNPRVKERVWPWDIPA